MRKRKNFFKMKNDGDMFVGAAIALMIGFMFTIIITFSFASWEKEFMTSDDIDYVATKYMKAMETVGCLDNDTKDKLQTELTALGITDISFTGTTVEPAEYGTVIRLHITGRLTMNGIMSLKTLFKLGNKTLNVDMQKSGTSMY